MKFKASKKQIEQLKKYLNNYGKNIKPTTEGVRADRNRTPAN